MRARLPAARSVSVTQAPGVRACLVGDGKAFGLHKTNRSVLGTDGAEVRSDEFDDPYESYQPPSSLWDPDFDHFLRAYPALVIDALTQWHETLSGARGMIVNHATNDVLILLRAVRDGDGRTAARTARAIFEHLVHYKEVASSRDKATQYEAHQHVTADQLARARIGLGLLRGKARKQEGLRLTALGRRAQRPLLEAMDRYGASFQRGWTAGTSVRSLAERHDLMPGYESYRILSGVMHGSAGALLGTRREKGSQVTHRLGMDLQLAPLAFHEGVAWWRAMLDDLPATAVHPDWGLGLREATDELLTGYVEVFAGCRRLDNRLWPTGGALPKRVAVLALYPNDKARWFLHDLAAGLLRPARLVGEAPEGMDELVAKLRPEVGKAGGRPATCAVLHVRVEPIEGRRPVHEAQLLLPQDIFGFLDEVQGSQ